MLQIVRLDPSDPFSVVLHFSPRLYQGVKDNVAVEIDDWDAGESVSFFCQDSFTIKRKDFGLLTSLHSLVKHRVEQNLATRVESLNWKILYQVLLTERRPVTKLVVRMVADTIKIHYITLFLDGLFFDIARVYRPREIIIVVLQFRVNLGLLFSPLRLNQNILGACRATLFFWAAWNLKLFAFKTAEWLLAELWVDDTGWVESKVCMQWVCLQLSRVLKATKH